MDPLLLGLMGLLGVVVGGWITGWNQRRERLHRRSREQLDGFYAPLLGIRARILAKSEVRLRIHGAADAAWRRLVGGRDPMEAIRVADERFPDFQRIIDEENRQLIKELLPLYRKMLDHFASNMGLAETSTRSYFGALTEFVEVWDRWLDGTLPPEVLSELGQGEDNLKPFYEDLADTLERARSELKK